MGSGLSFAWPTLSVFGLCSSWLEVRVLVGFVDGNLRCENGGKKHTQCLLKTSGKQQGQIGNKWDVASTATGPFRFIVTGCFRHYEQPTRWKMPYLVQLLFVISHKSLGAEIRNEEAFCTEIAWCEGDWVYKAFFFNSECLCCMQPYKKIPSNAAHLQSPSATPKSLPGTGLPWRSVFCKQLFVRLNGGNFFHHIPKPLAEQFCLSSCWPEWETSI